ncbi:MAG: SWIM zinc finger family protein [Acidimicrobiales bacterium]
MTARVHGSRAAPYRVQIRVRRFDDGEWTRVLDAISSRAAHAAALLDGELTPGVIEDVAAAGLELLPGAGEVGTLCSCPDWANPCKHAAAVCYLIADLFDEDPFVALLLRGRSRDEILAGLRARRSATVVRSRHQKPLGVATEDGVPAREAWAAVEPPVGNRYPLPPLPREHPGKPVPMLVDPPLSSGVSGSDLSDAAADAARRAWELLVGAGDGGLTLDAEADLARRAAAALGTPRFEQIAVRAERSGRSLLERAVTWQHCGSAGLAVSDESWRPPRSELDGARTTLRQIGILVRVRDNRLTLVGLPVQLRLGKEGGWHRFERRGGTWELAAPPATDLFDALGDFGPTDNDGGSSVIS